MQHHPILPLLLAVATVSAAPSNVPAELKYDRLAFGYASSSDARSYGLAGEALLGGHILVGGGIADEKFKSLSGISGRSTDFQLGYKFTLGQGDLILSAGYGQIQASGSVGTSKLDSVGDSKSLGLAWRQRLNEAWEYSVGYTYSRTVQTLRSTNTNSVVTSATATDHDSAVNFALRYNLTANVDVTFGYTFVSGGNVWSLSTGYNF
jgi:hypothetical protein